MVRDFKKKPGEIAVIRNDLKNKEKGTMVKCDFSREWL